MLSLFISKAQHCFRLFTAYISMPITYPQNVYSIWLACSQCQLSIFLVHSEHIVSMFVAYAQHAHSVEATLLKCPKINILILQHKTEQYFSLVIVQFCFFLYSHHTSTFYCEHSCFHLLLLQKMQKSREGGEKSCSSLLCCKNLTLGDISTI